MSDGIHPDPLMTLVDAAEFDGEATSFADASRSVRETAAKPFDRSKLLHWLPQLGPVLWLQRRETAVGKQPRLGTCKTLLLDHPSIEALTTSPVIEARQAITPQGPREWIGFNARDGSINAKLFLLPDSDVLAWDQMCAACDFRYGEIRRLDPPTHCTFLRRALARLGYRWQARLLEFHLKQRPWLSVLDAQPPLRISLLGIDIVRTIVRDENAEWLSPPQLA